MKVVLIASAFIFLAIASYLNEGLERPYIVISKQEAAWNINDDMIYKFHLGFKRLESAFLWVTTILESDIEHYKKKDLNSWMFLRFNTISKLEPKFFTNYSFGGIYLSIIKDDIPGASIIYNKGLAQFPDNYELLKDAAYHFHFEAEDYEKSHQIYSKLSSHEKAPTVILTSLARLEKDKGNFDTAFEILSTMLTQQKNKSSVITLKINEYLYAIKAEKDLNCLNQKMTSNSLKDCETKDFLGNYYQYKNGIYIAAKEWKPFGLKKKNRL